MDTGVSVRQPSFNSCGSTQVMNTWQPSSSKRREPFDAAHPVRGQVVHQVDALSALGAIDQMALGDAQGAYHQLLLTARENLRSVMTCQPYAKIRTLRSRLGVAHLLVAQQARSQDLQEVGPLSQPR